VTDSFVSYFVMLGDFIIQACVTVSHSPVCNVRLFTCTCKLSFPVYLLIVINLL